jgi:hypothetical protein
MDADARGSNMAALGQRITFASRTEFAACG